MKSPPTGCWSRFIWCPGSRPSVSCRWTLPPAQTLGTDSLVGPFVLGCYLSAPLVPGSVPREVGMSLSPLPCHTTVTQSLAQTPQFQSIWLYQGSFGICPPNVSMSQHPKNLLLFRELKKYPVAPRSCTESF